MFVICVISLVVFLSVSKITKKYMKQNSLKYVNSVNLPKDKMMMHGHRKAHQILLYPDHFL